MENSELDTSPLSKDPGSSTTKTTDITQTNDLFVEDCNSPDTSDHLSPMESFTNDKDSVASWDAAESKIPGKNIELSKLGCLTFLYVSKIH